MTKKKQKATKRCRVLLEKHRAIIISAIVLFLIAFLLMNRSGDQDEAPLISGLEAREPTADEHLSDFIDSEGSVVAEWSDPAATSRKGDQKFLLPGADYKDIYISVDESSISYLATTYGQIGEDTEYEFYLISPSNDYQIRIKPSEGAIVWERQGPSVTMIHPPQGFRYELQIEGVAVAFPRALFIGDPYVDLTVEIFSSEQYRISGDPSASHDSGQFPIPVRIDLP